MADSVGHFFESSGGPYVFANNSLCGYARNSTAPVSRLYIASAILMVPVDSSSLNDGTDLHKQSHRIANLQLVAL